MRAPILVLVDSRITNWIDYSTSCFLSLKVMRLPLAMHLIMTLSANVEKHTYMSDYVILFNIIYISGLVLVQR